VPASISGRYAGQVTVSDVRGDPCAAQQLSAAARIDATLLAAGTTLSGEVRSGDFPRLDCDYAGSSTPEGFIALSTRCAVVAVEVIGCPGGRRALQLFSQQLASYWIGQRTMTGWHVETWRDGETLLTVTHTFRLDRVGG
jgi:hypothetical protein